MTETAAPARPSLAHLPEPVRLRIAVAETQGCYWEECRSDLWTLRHPSHGKFYVAALDDKTFRGSDRFPDYEHDPAAWGALMEAGRIEAVPIRSSDLWYAIWYRDDGTAGSTPSMLSLGRVVCSAFLAKHGVESW